MTTLEKNFEEGPTWRQGTLIGIALYKGSGKFEGSSSSRERSHYQRKGKKQKNSKNHNPQEFKKSKPPSFDGEIRRGEEDEVWMLGLKKYFRVHDYSKNLKV